MSKTKLSKTVLQMKFMKRTREKVEKEEEELEGRNLYSSEITEKMLHGNSHIIFEPSYVICEGLVECPRFSYGGMNKEIERLMEEKQKSKRIKVEHLEQKQKEMKKDIDDNEMLKYYSSLVGTMKAKFKIRKVDRPNIGPPGIFLKPNDDYEIL